MPYKPKVPCRHPGCTELVQSGERYCAKHKAAHAGEMDPRPNANTRGYTRAWRSASKAYLQAHPLCVRCMQKGKYTKATVVDHIIPFRGDMKLFWDRNNWQPLCKPCHDKKTWTEDKYIKYTY